MMHLKGFIALMLVWIMMWGAIPIIATTVSGDTYEHMPTVPVENEIIEMVCPMDLLEFTVDTQFYVAPVDPNPAWTWRPHVDRIEPSVGNVTWAAWHSDIDNWEGGVGVEFADSINNTIITHTDLMHPFNFTTGNVTIISDRMSMEADSLDVPLFLVYANGTGNLDLATYFHKIMNGDASIVPAPDWAKIYSIERIEGENQIYFDVLNGESVSIITDLEFNGYRETMVRVANAFNYSYYTSQKLYEATRTVENVGEYNWSDASWFIGFPANRAIDYNTVSVYDLNNDVELVLGENYDVTFGGIRMHWDTFDVGQSRSVKVNFYGYNASQGMGIAIAYTDSYTTSSQNGASCFLSEPTWTNDYGRTYQGAVILRIALEDGNERYIDPASVKVYDNVQGRYLEPWEWSIAAGQVTVDYATVTVGDVQSYKVYYTLDMQTGNGWSLTDELIPGVPYWLALLFLGLLCVGWAIATKNEHVRRINIGLIIVLVSIGFIVWYFNQVGVV